MTTNTNVRFHLVLGSASPRRKELISYLDLPYSIVPADIDENIAFSSPQDLVTRLAEEKAKASFARVKLDPGVSPLVLASDTTVALDQQIFNKPSNVDEARTMLKILRGKTHSVYTGVCFYTEVERQIKKHSFYIQSHVTFTDMSDHILEQYLKTGDSLDKAGSYGIQGPSLTFISRVEGSYSNVVGLPLSDVVEQLSRFVAAFSVKDWNQHFV